MSNMACDCCTEPALFRVELQYVSFSRDCNNRCFFFNNGIFYNKMSGSATQSGDLSSSELDEHYERVTNASSEYLNASNSEDGCECSQIYSETQESHVEDKVLNIEMNCSGSVSNSECPIESCSGLNVPAALTYGIGVIGSATYTDQPNNISVTDSFGENCELGGCYAPIITDGENSYYLPVTIPTSTVETPYDDLFSGNVLECDWEEEDQVPHFPDFLNITCCKPEYVGISCFQTEQPPEQMPSGEGYLSSAYKFYNQHNKRQKSERFCKYRIVHNPTPTCYLKIWLTKKITNYISTDPILNPYTISDITYETIEYEWTGETVENKKCLKNNTNYFDLANLVISDEFDLDVGDVSTGNGRTIEIAIKKISIINGYEPEDPTNGYPFVEDTSGRCNTDIYPKPECQ